MQFVLCQRKFALTNYLHILLNCPYKLLSQKTIFAAMNNFGLFFTEGIRHITDLNGSDHILFIAALCLRYMWSDWRRLLILVTAFTVGHSITLALSALNIVHFPTAWIEFLIPVTIVITALNNVWAKDESRNNKLSLTYWYALFFGLIHGVGFSTLLKSMFGRNENVVPELLGFNLGLEVGQLVIVAVVLLISFIFVRLLRVQQKAYILFVSGGICFLALQMAAERFPFRSTETTQEITYEETAPLCIGNRRCFTTSGTVTVL